MDFKWNIFFQLKSKFLKVEDQVLNVHISHQDLYSPWNSPGQNTGVGSCSLLQGIFPNQESNWSLLHCRQILYQLELPRKLICSQCIKIIWELLKNLVSRPFKCIFHKCNFLCFGVWAKALVFLFSNV